LPISRIRSGRRVYGCAVGAGNDVLPAWYRNPGTGVLVYQHGRRRQGFLYHTGNGEGGTLSNGMDVMARSKEAMLVKSLLLALGACLLSATAALAFALGMGGENGVMVETADALYAGDAHGRTMRIVQAGALAPDGGVISDIGVPALAPDGSVIFGAEVRLSERVAWQILRADPNAEDPSRIQKVMDTSDLRSSCKPVIRTDPYVAPGGDGSVSFVATVEGGGVALFRYAA